MGVEVVVECPCCGAEVVLACMMPGGHEVQRTVRTRTAPVQREGPGGGGDEHGQ